jgi:hypothetical protein
MQKRAGHLGRWPLQFRIRGDTKTEFAQALADYHMSAVGEGVKVGIGQHESLQEDSLC